RLRRTGRGPSTLPAWRPASGFASCVVLLVAVRTGALPPPPPGDHCCVLGLRASSRPSPTKLNDRTVNRRATPGKVMNHHAVSKMPVASAIIDPQLAVGG